MTTYESQRVAAAIDDSIREDCIAHLRALDEALPALEAIELQCPID